jgi:hypothetical protein
MKTINYPLIWDYVKAYIFPILLIILLVNYCTSQPSPQVAVDKANFQRLKQNNAILQERVKSVLYQSKIKIKEVKAKDSLIALRELERDNLKQQLDVVIIDAKVQRNKIASLDNKGFATYYNERFKTNTAIVTDKGIELTKDLPTKVASSLIDGDVAKAELGITRKILENEFEKSNLLTGQVAILKEDNVRLNLGLNETIGQNSELLELAGSQNKSIKKLERKQKISGILVPVGVAVGFALGVIFAN